MAKSLSEFEIWWRNEGSGITPNKNEDTEEFAKRITSIAWHNGEYCHKNKFFRPVGGAAIQTAESPHPRKPEV